MTPSAPLKIALVILHADPARGGAERYTLDLAAALARRGHDVSIVASSFACDCPPAKSIPLEAAGATRARRYGRFLDAIDRHLAGEAYDVVHAMLPVRRCDVYHPHAGLAAGQMAKLNRLFNPRRRAMAAVERDLLLGDVSPIVISLSRYVKRSILAHYPGLGDRVMTLFNAVDLDRFEPAPAPAHPGVEALFIGHDIQRKGLMETLAALQRVDDPRLHLTVVGRDLDKLKPTSRVEIRPPSNDPRPFYRSADFFVLPTKHDPCSLVVLEALAMGVPVITTVRNGAAEVMTDGVHGYILNDPADVAALAEAMRRMLEPQRRAAMRQACLALRPTLSYEHHLEQLMGIYAAAMQRPRPGRPARAED